MENTKMFNLFNDSKNISEVLFKINLCDNSFNRNKIKKLMLDINFDINTYKENKKKYCKKCGKLLTNNRNIFCSSSCSVSFNNIGRKISDNTKEKISNTLKNKNNNTIKTKKIEKTKKTEKPEKTKNEKKCLNCGKEINSNSKFCSRECTSKHNHNEHYKYYISNPEEFNRGNYTPKQFKDFFLTDQNNKCSICKHENEWNSKKLIFVLDHIDGDASNNNRENLRMICPNCDSQTDTFKSKNKNSKRKNYWKEKIINDIKKGGYYF